MSDPQPLLLDASTKIGNGEWGLAFDSLLDAWRCLRAVEIASLCEALSERAARDKPIRGKTQTERTGTWTKMFHERSALGLGVLLADLDALWAEHAQPRFVLARIEALTTVRDDPRMVPAMFEVLPHVNFGGAWHKVLVRIVRALEATGDPRVFERLEALASQKKNPAIDPQWGKETAARLQKKSKDHTPPPLPDELRSIVSTIRVAIDSIPETLVIATPARAKPTGCGSDPATLLDQVRASPDDDELRLILADALVAAGDPLGEFIVLQSRRASGESTPKTIARERSLLKANMKKWLGAIAPVVKMKTAVFERGFLERCDAVAHKHVEAEIHFQHPEWATVRSIFFTHVARITAAMKSLREVRNVDNFGVHQLAEAGHPKLERLGVSGQVVYSEDAMKALVECLAERLPQLVHFEITSTWLDPTKIAWVWNAPWAKQLRSFGMPAQDKPLAIKEFRAREQLDELHLDPMSDVRTIVRKVRSPSVMGDDEIDLHILIAFEKQLYQHGEPMVRNLFDRLGNSVPRIREVTIAAVPTLETTPPQRERINEAATKAFKDASKITLPFPG